MAHKPRGRHLKNTATQPADKRIRARRVVIGLPEKVSKDVRSFLHIVAVKFKKRMNVLRRSLFRLIRKCVLFLMAKTGSAGASADKTAVKKRFSRRRYIIYAGSGLIVVVVVLLVLFVPSKAAVHPAAVTASTSPVGTSALWQASVDNAIPTTPPDIMPIATTPPDTATPEPEPTPTPEPEPTPTKKPKATATPEPEATATSKPKATATPKPDPTATPKPTVDMDSLVDYFVVSEGPYYEEGVNSSNHYDYTDEELTMLAIIIQREAGGESTDGKIAVGNVVINRVLCGRWGSNIDAVKGQFSYSPDTVPKQSAIDAAHSVLDNEVWKVPQNAYFFKPSGGSWSSYTLWGQIGNHYFYTANYSGRNNGSFAEMYARVYKYAQYGCKPENRVKRIQLLLKALGYEVNTDKYFEETTKAALMAFQNDAGMSADGVAGRKTVEALINKYGFDKYIKDFVD